MIYRSKVITDFAFLLHSIEETIRVYWAYGLGCDYTICVTEQGFIVNYSPYEF